MLERRKRELFKLQSTLTNAAGVGPELELSVLAPFIIANAKVVVVVIIIILAVVGNGACQEGLEGEGPVREEFEKLFVKLVHGSGKLWDGQEAQAHAIPVAAEASESEAHALVLRGSGHCC